LRREGAWLEIGYAETSIRLSTNFARHPANNVTQGTPDSALCIMALKPNGESALIKGAFLAKTFRDGLF
jgi:hypothetical protein